MNDSREKPYGLPIKSGRDAVKRADWEAIVAFIQAREWFCQTPCLAADQSDSLLSDWPGYGLFPLCFDFHLSEDGPKLIEINTNAGGFASVIHINEKYAPQCEAPMAVQFIEAIREEYRLAGFAKPLQTVAIVDANLKQQALYPEMLFFQKILSDAGVLTRVVEPSDFLYDDRQGLQFSDGVKIDLVYNRLTDFRLKDPCNRVLREALLTKQIALTPHPAAYVRVADKRNLLRLNSPLNPPVMMLQDRPLDDWVRERNQWVFKPPESAGSKGVYRGEKISVAKLKTLSPETVVQSYVPAPRAFDGSKFDLRVYSYDTKILGMVSRHFEGQVMEMRSELSGLREAVPEFACCFAKAEIK